MADEQPWIRPARPVRRLRVAGAVTALAALMLCVGAAGVGTFSFQSVWRASGPVRDTADGFLREVVAGDVDTAYERLCADTRERWSALGFAAWVRTPPVLTRHEIVDVSVATRAGRPHGTVRVRLTRAAGPVQDRQVPVVREDGRWRVCGDPF
ncbi:hypothetical protein V6U90_25760 [Micromonospora sp. CPCC 206060]|uniref:Rv0361 family membrane protein n=1 Tax=Micromonospora sp. CPCC 206060 TaxID=3122406 RepID=UPI002FF19E37